MRHDTIYDVRYGYDAKRYDTLVRDNDGSPSPDRVREPIKFSPAMLAVSSRCKDEDGVWLGGGGAEMGLMEIAILLEWRPLQGPVALWGSAEMVGK